MTIAIITEAGVRKVAPLVVVAQQAAALAQLYAGVAEASVGNRIYPDYATGNAATSAGQYFFVASAGAYALHIHGTATALAPFPVLDPATGNLGIGTSSPAMPLHINKADQSVARLRLQNTGTGGHAFDIIAGLHGASNEGISIRDVTAGATRLNITNTGDLGICSATVTAVFGHTMQISDGSANGTVSIVGTSGAGYMATFGASLIVAGRTGMSLALGANDSTKMTLSSSYIVLDVGLSNYADDSAAAAGGVPVKGLYRTGSAVKMRVS